jgi:hypothetical protein
MKLLVKIILTIVKSLNQNFLSDLFPYHPFTQNRHTFIATLVRHSEASNLHFINGRRHFESVQTIVTLTSVQTIDTLTRESGTRTIVTRTQENVTQTNVVPLSTIALL